MAQENDGDSHLSSTSDDVQLPESSADYSTEESNFSEDVLQSDTLLEYERGKAYDHSTDCEDTDGPYFVTTNHSDSKDRTACFDASGAYDLSHAYVGSSLEPILENQVLSTFSEECYGIPYDCSQNTFDVHHEAVQSDDHNNLYEATGVLYNPADPLPNILLSSSLPIINCSIGKINSQGNETNIQETTNELQKEPCNKSSFSQNVSIIIVLFCSLSY